MKIEEKVRGDFCKKFHTNLRWRKESRRVRSPAKRIRSNSDTSSTASSSPSSLSSSPQSSTTSRSAPSDSDGEGSGASGARVSGSAGESAQAHVSSPCASNGSASIVGRRREMEDAVAIKPMIGSTVTSAYDFFGVYDGHGGEHVAAACRERLHAVLADVVGGDWPEGAGAEERWRRVMAECFAKVDEEVAVAGEGADASEKTVGSTAVVAVVGAAQIVVANCGDSRAVLSRGGVAVPLSSDHKVLG